MNTLNTIAFWLLVIGGLNWGLSALGWNVVNMILGSWPMVPTLICGLSLLNSAISFLNLALEHPMPRMASARSRLKLLNKGPV